MSTISLVHPRKTRTVSLTATVCDLKCAHCGGHYLKGMETPQEVANRGPRHYTSALISGGMDRSGRLPLEDHADFYMLLKSWGWKLNFHGGLLSPGGASFLDGYADALSFDFITDSATIREVYGLAIPGSTYVSTYRALKKKFHVIPHLTAGVKAGHLRGESEALAALAGEEATEVVFLVFIPTRGTRYQDSAPPPLDEVKRLFARGRDLLPRATFTLGCMHPRGAYGTMLERCALDCGFERFVMPSQDFRKSLLADDRYRVVEKEECCVI
ncbi:MAG: radical SAM protein [Candidatus Eremiobacteraeota bacterium]|nr:radical SAM protein [Candidatus Eremiobacteraeota bacterium]